MGPEVVLCDVT